MNPIARLARLLRGLFRRRREDDETAEELRFHLELEAEKNMRAGMPPGEARRRARLRLGGADGIREAVRDLAPPRVGQEVVARPAVVLGDPPLRVDPALPLHALERRIQRALLDREHVARHGLDPLGQPPPVHRLQRERAQHEELERALQNVGAVCAHSDSLFIFKRNCGAASSDCQDKSDTRPQEPATEKVEGEVDRRVLTANYIPSRFVRTFDSPCSAAQRSSSTEASSSTTGTARPFSRRSTALM